MLIGILSDSHGRHLAVRAALALFDQLGVEHVIHCGDVCGVSVFDELAGRPVTFVWGNCDLPDAGLYAYLQTIDLQVPDNVPTVIELGGRRIAVFHGHEPAFANGSARLDVDYVLHGHTHSKRDERLDNKRIVNPGALHRANPKTVATLDTNTDTVQFYTLPA